MFTLCHSKSIDRAPISQSSIGAVASAGDRRCASRGCCFSNHINATFKMFIAFIRRRWISDRFAVLTERRHSSTERSHRSLILSCCARCISSNKNQSLKWNTRSYTQSLLSSRGKEYPTSVYFHHFCTCERRARPCLSSIAMLHWFQVTRRIGVRQSACILAKITFDFTHVRSVLLPVSSSNWTNMVSSYTIATVLSLQTLCTCIIFTLGQFIYTFYLQTYALSWPPTQHLPNVTTTATATSVNSSGKCPQIGSSRDSRVQAWAQQQSADLFFWTNVWSCCPIIIMTYILGLYTPKLGRRFVLILPMIGIAVQLIIWLAIIYFHLPKHWWYIAAFIVGLSGSDNIRSRSCQSSIHSACSPSTFRFRS